MKGIPEEIQELSQELRELKKQDENKYFSRYFNELFPKVHKIVQHRMETQYAKTYSRIQRKYYGLIQTVGESPEPLMLSILLLLPKEVLLIHTPETKEHAKLVMREAHKKLGRNVPFIRSKEVNSSNPVEVYQAVKEQWKNDGRTIAIDVSGGKKSMTSGASLAVGILNVDILYVDNEGYDSEARRPVDGAEFINLLPNPMQVFGDLEKTKAIELFKKLNYGGAAQMFEKLYHAIPLDDIGYGVYQLLAEAYDSWDNLEIEKACEKMTVLCEKLELQMKFGKAYPLTEHFMALQAQQHILEGLVALFQESQASKTKGIGKTLLQGQDGLQRTLILIFSLYQNAKRREQQQKYDMGALLLYRVLELIEQRRLAEHRIDTANAVFSEAQVEQMKKRLSKRLRKNLLWHTKKKDTTSKNDGKPMLRRIPLIAGYIALLGLDDPIADSLDVLEIQQQVTTRNTSIFAHGFHAINADEYRDFRNFVENVLQKFCEIENVDMKTLNKQYQFVQPF